MAKTGDIFSEIFINPDGTTSRYDHSPLASQNDNTWVESSDQHRDPNNNISTSSFWHTMYVNGSERRVNGDTPMNHQYHRVFSFSYQDKSGKIVPVTGAGSPHARTYMKLTDGTQILSSFRYDIGLSNTNNIRLANDLSAQEVFDQTPVGDTSYSLQKDGSVLIGYNFNSNQLYYDDNMINDAVDSQYYFNYQHPEQKEAWRQATLNAYHKNGMHPTNVGDFEQFIYPANDQAYNSLIVEVTPDTNTQTAIDRQQGNTADGQAGYMQNALVKYVDQNTGKQISVQPIMGGQDKDVKFVANVPTNYVLTDFNNLNFTYHFRHDNNPDKIIYVLPKIVGTSTSKLKQNASNLLDFELKRARSDSNIQLIEDSLVTYNFSSKIDGDLMKKAQALAVDYDNQALDINQQLNDYFAKKAQGQNPQLVIHYHEGKLEESISPEYKIIQQKPDGTSVTLTDIHPTFERTGAVNLVDKSVDWYKGYTDWYYGYFDKNGTIHKDDHITDGWQLTNAGGLM